MKEDSEDAVDQTLDGRSILPSNASETIDESNKPSSLVLASLGLLIACFLLGLFACELNKQLYQHHAPFYDSLSYNEKMFRVMTTSRESGLMESMELACFTNNTNCLPFLIGAVIAPLVEPSRAVGIWIQTGLFFLLLVSLLFYLARVRRLSAATAMAGCLTFLCARCLFLQNGGISDFRMDFSLFVGFGMTCVWFLSAMEIPKSKHFLMLGVSASICCLLRATAPIYLLFALAPLFAIELFQTDQRKKKLIGLLLASLVVVVLTGWFYAINFEFLKYYYFEWNTDANAKIPFVDALQHWKMAQRSVGEPLAIMIVVWGVFVLLMTRKSQSIGKWVRSAIENREIDWRIGWMGLAPVLLMVARRAGLNPFVSMPAVFGLILFFTLPSLGQIDRLNDKVLKRFCWIVLLATLTMTFARGWTRHTRIEFDSMKPHHVLIDAMVSDAKARGRNEITFTVAQITDLDANILYSTLLFDRPESVSTLNGVVVDGVNIKRIAAFAYPAEADWKRLAGDDDESKVQGLIAYSNDRVDYLIVANELTSRKIPQTLAHNVVNRHLVRIRDLVTQDQRWIPIKHGVQVTDAEVVEMYRNTSRD